MDGSGETRGGHAMSEWDSRDETVDRASLDSAECVASDVEIPQAPSRWMRFFSHRWTLFGLRLVLGGLFLYAGITKVRNPQAFADSIATFQVLPAGLINLVALSLPPFEILLGAMLVMGWRLRAGFAGSFLLAAAFVLALGQGIARGLPLDCGCFGSGEPSVMSGWFSLGRAFLLLLVSGCAFAGEVRQTGKSGAGRN